MWRRRLFVVLASALMTACASTRSVSFDDARIKEDVAGALNADHLQGIQVSVVNGRVTLIGLVATDAARAEAGADAERVPGVVAVDNQIGIAGH
ncbi:MAG TPA: BON domain-containing protein [Rhodanobacteraceae bacterium]